MIVDIMIELSKYSLYFVLITGIQFLLFFLFAKYKTDRSFQELFQQYSSMFMHALFFALSLLVVIAILTKSLSACTIATVLLCISSLSIILKYIDVVKEHWMILFDLWILLSNMYVIYTLITQEAVSLTHYMVLYTVVLYVFVYQQVRKLYKVDTFLK